MRTSLYFFIVTCFLISCKTETANDLDMQLAEFDQLKEETLDLHDEVMPDLGLLMDLDIAIEERLQSDSLDPVVAEELIIAQMNLNDAHEAMMDWMKDYSASFPFEAVAPETIEELREQKPVLEESFETMQKVKTDTKDAIARAELLLETSS